MINDSMDARTVGYDMAMPEKGKKGSSSGSDLCN
jgi:hypothetical protein